MATVFMLALHSCLKNLFSVDFNYMYIYACFYSFISAVYSSAKVAQEEWHLK